MKIISKLLLQRRPFVIFAAWHICGFFHSGKRAVKTPAFAFCAVWIDRDPHSKCVGLSYARPIRAGRAVWPWSGKFVCHKRTSFAFSRKYSNFPRSLYRKIQGLSSFCGNVAFGLFVGGIHECPAVDSWIDPTNHYKSSITCKPHHLQPQH